MLREHQGTRGGGRSSGQIKRGLQDGPSKASPAKVATAAAAETARLFASNLNQVRYWPEEIHALGKRYPKINQSLSTISETDHWINTHFTPCHLSPACACFWALLPGSVEEGFFILPPPNPRPLPFFKSLQARCLHLCCQAIHFPNPGLLLCRTSLRETRRGRTDTAAKGGVQGFTKTLNADHVRAKVIASQRSDDQF